MSKELFEIVQGMDLKRVETQLAIQCAPLLAGLKISNLLIIPLDGASGSFNLHKVAELLKDTEISYHVLLITGEKMILLLYDAKRMEAYVSNCQAMNFLKRMGYQNFQMEEILMEFTSRYRRYEKKELPFPHEMGILLGYPIEDIEGFIRNGGQKSLYTGYWKVYENLADKLQLFHEFEMARSSVILMASRGVHMQDIIGFYQAKRQTGG